jgi:hypothetical protein
MIRIRFLISALILCSLAFAGEKVLPPVQSFNGKTAAWNIIDNKAIDEASGLAHSRINDQLLWTINDSGDEPVLYALGSNGENFGSVFVQDVKNHDWEDLVSFQLNRTAWLLIADVGDNPGKRKSCELIVIKEPAMNRLQPTVKMTINSEWRIRFRYENGPRDCEAVAVDIKNRQVLLMSKRIVPPTLYSVPLIPDDDHTQVARAVCRVPGMAFSSNDSSDISRQPTAMDISPDGYSSVVLTYTHLLQFIRNPGQSWAEVFTGSPLIIAQVNLYQAESVCFDSKGEAIFITSEKHPAPLVRLDL